ncbi:BtpA/SgcQ family protein [Patescibacteria group bacterium]
MRVAVFVDHVRTSYGDILGHAYKVIEFRKELGAEDICLFTDIQVKHSELLNIRPIEDSALEAIEKDSDGLIVTGKWTGDAPNLEKLASVRKAVKDFPIIIGSGATKDNMSTLLEYADAIIVGTALKTGKVKDKSEEVNLKSYEERVNLKEAISFVKKFNNLTNK